MTGNSESLRMINEEVVKNDQQNMSFPENSKLKFQHEDYDHIDDTHLVDTGLGKSICLILCCRTENRSFLLQFFVSFWMLQDIVSIVCMYKV